MENFQGTINPTGTYVRALYDYEADDQTSLSFRQGDIIQVLTQLESGWWDGVIRGHRGWFPSNYCESVDSAEAEKFEQEFPPSDDGEYDESDVEYDHLTQSATLNGHTNGATGAANTNEEEAAFWIPQATPDGRLFYFNTLTGVSTVELPLEAPATGAGQDRGALRARDSVRPAPEMMAAGYETEDNSERDPKGRVSQMTAKQHHRTSYMSDGASPATSLESLTNGSRSQGVPGTPMTSSFTSAQSGGHSRQSSKPTNGGSSRSFLDDSFSVPLTWPRLVEDMKRSVERFKQAVHMQERAELVRRAEDISDHLRLLLAAGSGTTDNHSGYPSIIASNKALYPPFRDMMSRFSKLVLSTHIAAPDYASPDSFNKCLQEADGMLHGVYNFVEVARHQRSEEIPRLTPGFVKEGKTGGSWQSNGLSKSDSIVSGSFIDQDEHEPAVEPTAQLQYLTLERLTDQKRSIVSEMRRLEQLLVVNDRYISNKKHRKLSTDVCNAAFKVVERFRTWINIMESVDLTPAGLDSHDRTMLEFCNQKQKLYMFVGELLMSSQAVAAPLVDEWEAHQGDTLESRLDRVKHVSRGLEVSTTQVYQSFQNFLEIIKQRYASGQAPQRQSRLDMRKEPARPIRSPEATGAFGKYSNAGSRKAEKVLGETIVGGREGGPVQTVLTEDMPEFLGLDYGNEIQYDDKTEPPTIKGGTLSALVEQLTRHDRYDAPFKTTFLLTYQSFTTATELFHMLVRRWTIQPPLGLTDDEFRVWTEKKLVPIRLRVVNVMKAWIDTFWMEGNDEQSKELMTQMYGFAKDAVAGSETAGWKPLLTVIEQRMRGEDIGARRLVPTEMPTPTPLLPKNMKKLKFTDIDPTEFARQLTIIESKLYCKIKPHECLNKIWQKKTPGADSHEPASNVKALILHSNRLTNLVAEMILHQSDLAKRANVVKHFIHVADKCLALNNFSTLTSIISALGTAPIHRLSRTWSKLGKNTAATLEKMRKLMASTKNFAPYRQALHAANPPCIPFFGVYLTDLTFIEDGMSSTIRKTELINFAKRAKTAEVIREIQTYQNVNYPFRAVSELQGYILDMMQSAGDVHEMYERSLQVEPREREDEKIARLVDYLH
ncbi:MAG: hypothetical protein Q9162_007374 [Coniocarpon cinnabarinum]